MPVPPVVEVDPRLYETEDFAVESPQGEVARVEEIWVGETNEPRALAVRTAEGRHGLLLGEDVLAVDRENRWVVVPGEPVLFELDAPRLVRRLGGRGETVLAASWATTGELLQITPRHARDHRLQFRRTTSRKPAESGEPPLVRWVAVLLASLFTIVALVTALAFLVARLVTGSAY